MADNPRFSPSTNPMTSRELYLRLLRFVLPYWKIFAVSVAAMAILAATEPAFPALLKPMLDGSFVEKDKQWIVMAPLLLIGLFIIRGITSYVSSYTVSWVGNRLVLDLRQGMFDKLVNLPTRYYDHNSSGNLIATVAFNVSQVTEAATTVITTLVRDSLTILGLAGWMLWLDWRLTLMFLVITPIITLTVKIVSRRLRHVSREYQRSIGDITHVLEETISGQKVVKIFGGQGYESARFHDATNRTRQFAMKQTIASAAHVPLVQFIAALALAAIVYVASLNEATTVGSFVSFLTAMLLLFSPIKRLTSINEPLQRGLAAAETVFNLMDEPPEEDSGSKKLPATAGDIVLEDLHFRYAEDGPEALAGVDLSIPAGKTFALVGHSGSGKSTLANLIPRFYDASAGRILVNGDDIRDYPLAELRGMISLVSQEVVLFNDTVFANIAYGTKDRASEEEVVRAAEAAHAMEFIRDMPQGLQTLIGERGVRLSGGQRQRLAIARALYKNAPILILDEATGALDSHSERMVQKALDALMKNRTTLVIAHRLSTIERADCIVVMSKGKILEAGRHEELLARNGTYADLYHIQFRERA